VQKLKVPEGKADVVVFDEKLRGFGVRKFAKGHASYFVKYSVNGKPRKATFGPVVEGNLKAMRLEASEVLAKARRGIDAFAEKRAEAEATARLKTLGQLVPEYLAVREKGDNKWEPLKPKTFVEFARCLNKSWQPLHDKLITEITRDMVERQGDAVADAVPTKRGHAASKSGAVTANRAHTALAGLFKWAIKSGYVTGVNPTDNIDPLIEHSRKRVRADRAWARSGER
jgi:hypothetical protein